MLHVDAVGEEPKLAMANLKVVEVCAGDLHRYIKLVVAAKNATTTIIDH